MSQSFKKRFRLITLYILLPLVVAKLLWSIALFFLSKDASLNLKNKQSYSYHYSLNIADKFITSHTPLKEMPKEDDGEKLNGIRLKGTYLGGDASFIIIEDGGESKFIYIGEKFRGYRLDRVGERKVVFTKNGKNYYVLLDSESKNRISKSSNLSSPHKSDEQNSNEDSTSASISRDEMKSYIKNPDKIWNNIRIQEIRKNGQLGGFRVNYVKHGSFFDKAGLRSGDVIKAIDGEEIRSLGDVMKYYTNADSLDSLSLTVERGGREIDLDFSVN